MDIGRTYVTISYSAYYAINGKGSSTHLSPLIEAHQYPRVKMAALSTALAPWDFSPQQQIGEISALEANWTKEAVSTGVSQPSTGMLGLSVQSTGFSAQIFSLL